MFIILLTFSRNKSMAGQFMAEHNRWVKRGIADGLFLLAGSLQPGLGGAILAQATDRETLGQYLAEDPFIREDIVDADVLTVAPSMADERLHFLLTATTT